jgi:elongation of very long chain fatty acids protein 7
MESVSTRFYSLIEEFSDERTKEWWLMDRPLTIISICAAYVILVKIGPKLMENRKPFELNRIMMIYNVAQVVFNAYIFKELMLNGWMSGYSFRCEPNNPAKSGKPLRMALAVYYFTLSKFTDFIDTLFFVLRKKNSQISVLHVFHHATTPISAWAGTFFAPVGHGSMIALLNSFVHIVMYGYYAITAMGLTTIAKMMKKSITTIQLTQFVIVMTHSFQLLFTECDYNKWVAYFYGVYALMFFVLFMSFYIQSYSKKTKKQ